MPRRVPRGAIVYLGFLLILVVFSITLRDSGFLTVDNFLNILRQTAFVSIMAFGMTFALSAGEIDLSIGQVVALSAMVAAVLLRDTNMFIAVPAALGVGLVVGLANGVLTTRLRVPSFLITLGMAGIIGGLSRWITQTQPVPGPRRGVHGVLRVGRPGPGAVAAAVDPRRAPGVARGVPQDHLRPGAAGHGWQPGRGALLGHRHQPDPDRVPGHLLVRGQPRRAAVRRAAPQRPLHAGESDLLTVIAAAVIGGTSMSGGRGSMVGALVGSLVMGILNNGLILMGLSVTEQMIARGLIIIVAVALSLREAPEA